MSFINQTLVAPVITAAKAEQSGIANLIATTDAAIQKWVDVMILRAKTGKKEFMKGNSRTNEARKEIGELFAKIAPVAGWQESAVRNYQTSFWIAFETGKPFVRTLYQGKTTAGRGAQTGKAGKVETTDYDAIVATIKKAIKQATMLEDSALSKALLKVGKAHIEADWTIAE